MTNQQKLQDMMNEVEEKIENINEFADSGDTLKKRIIKNLTRE